MIRVIGVSSRSVVTLPTLPQSAEVLVEIA
jgi:hypothetical protein